MFYLHLYLVSVGEGNTDACVCMCSRDRIGSVSGFAGPVRCTNLNWFDFMQTNICHYEKLWQIKS